MVASVDRLERRILRIAMGVIVLALALGAPGPGLAQAQTVGYTFTKIAETTGIGTYTQFFAPAVIDDGRVFFVAETSSGERVLLSGDGNTLTTVIDSSLPGLTFFEDSIWDVNNAGTVAFSGTVNGETNVFTTALAGLTPINDPTDPNGVNGTAGFAIGNSGNVALTDLRRMALGNGGPLSLLFDASVDSSLPANHFFLTMNSNDVIAFLGFTQAGSAVYRVTSGGTLTTIGSMPQAIPQAIRASPQINDAGIVVFQRRTATSGPGTRTIVTGSGGALQTVVANGTVFSDFGAPGINNAGTVVFLAITAPQGGAPSRVGAFAGPDAVADAVLLTGDPLFGSHVIGVLATTNTDGFGRPGLNNNGQLAFLATLEDGRRVVVRANPGPIPNHRPVVTTPGNQTATRGQAITPLSIQASDADGDTLTYRASGLPPGLSINASTGAITGTPGPSSAGNWSTTVSVSDGRAATLVNFLWTVVTTASPTVQFDRAAYTVSETAGGATITVTRTGSTTGAVTVRYATSPGSATAGSDYTTTSGTLTIGAGLTSATFTVPILTDAAGEAAETVNLALSSPSGATLGTPSTAVLTITDGPTGGTLRFSAATYSAPEPAGPPGATSAAVTITVIRDGLATSAVSVGYSTADGTATAGADYVAASGALTVPAGQRMATFTITLLHDALVEGSETVNLALTNPTGGAVLGAPSTAVLTITDNDMGGMLRFSASAYTVAEDAGQATLKVLRTAGTAGAVTVQYTTIDGTAIAGTDYTTTSGTLTFDAGMAERTFTVPILDNAVPDGNRVLTVGLSAPGGGGVLMAPSTSTVTIVDNEATLKFSSGAYSVSETTPAASITVVRTGSLAGTLTVQYATSDGTATSGQDYTAVAGMLTFPAGVTSKTFTVPISNDALAEGPETLTLTLSNPAGGALLGTPRTAELTITDNDAGGVFQFSAAAYTVSEPSGATPQTVTITVTRTVPVGQTPAVASVDYATSDGTATAGQDYTPVAGTLLFGASVLTRTVTVPILHDTVVEGAETIKLTLSNPTGGATLGARSTAAITVTDNDLGGTLRFSAATYTVGEGAGQATITVSRLAGAASGVTVQYATSDGTAVAGTDYTATAGALTFGAGETTKTFTVPILDNAVADGNRVLTVALSAPGGGGVLTTPGTATLTILDDEVAVRFSAASYTVSEAGGTATVTVVRTGPTTPVVTVQYAASDGTATAGQDYTPVAGTLTFPAGVTSKTFTVPIINDALAEGPETLTLTLSTPGGGALLGTPSTAELTITDNDAGGVFQFSAAAYTAREPSGVTPQTVTITVTRTVPAGQTPAVASVDYATSDGTATAGEDYTATAGTLLFGAGVLTRTFTVPILHDTVVEGAETITLTLSNPTGGAALGARSTAAITVTDNDLGGTLRFSAATYTVGEAAGQATITVSRLAGAASGVTVQYATSDGTAVAGTDYTATAGALTFGAGETTKTFTVPIADNGIADGDRSLGLTLLTPGGGGVLGVPSSAMLRIVDDEVAVRFSAASYTVSEAGGTATVTVVRTGPTTPVVTVQYAASDGTATAGQDYTAVAGTLTFPAGVTSKTFTVPISNDALAEGAETLTLTLSNPVGGALLGTPSTAELTITDNDAGGTFEFSAAAYTVSEPSGVTPQTATITVTRTVPAGQTPAAASVDYATTNASAAAGADYTSATGTLVFPASMLTRTFTVTVLPDTLDEPAETVLLMLLNPTGGAILGARSTAVLTIVDND